MHAAGSCGSFLCCFVTYLFGQQFTKIHDWNVVIENIGKYVVLFFSKDGVLQAVYI